MTSTPHKGRILDPSSEDEEDDLDQNVSGIISLEQEGDEEVNMDAEGNGGSPSGPHNPHRHDQAQENPQQKSPHQSDKRQMEE